MFDSPATPNKSIPSSKALAPEKLEAYALFSSAYQACCGDTQAFLVQSVEETCDYFSLFSVLETASADEITEAAAFLAQNLKTNNELHGVFSLNVQTAQKGWRIFGLPLTMPTQAKRKAAATLPWAPASWPIISSLPPL